jgi:hypothetical protein
MAMAYRHDVGISIIWLSRIVDQVYLGSRLQPKKFWDLDLSHPINCD